MMALPRTTRTPTRLALVVTMTTCGLIITASPRYAAADDEPLAAAYAVPETLAALLHAKGKDEQTILSQRARDYFNALPTTAKALLAQAAAAKKLTSPQHLAAVLVPELRPQELEVLLHDNCVLCHTSPDEQSETSLFAPTDENENAAGGDPHLSITQFVNDVHFRAELSCAGCHGGDPTNDEMDFDAVAARWPEDRTSDRAWIPAFCARCHANPTLMGRFSPALPTDQLAKYRTSTHGKKLLQEGDSKVAQCVSCHGAHGIRSSKSPKSKVHARQVANTCGHCHADASYMAGYETPAGKPLPTNQLEQYLGSVHGKALMDRGDLGAPTCNDCHGSHSATPPEVTAVSRVCRTCHVGNGGLFDSSAHKQAFEKHGWPECETCHSNHGVQHPTDAMISDTAGTICHDCHQRYSKSNPLCDATARYFRATIDTLVATRHEYDSAVEHLARRGLDVDGLVASLDSLSDAIRTSRSRIHTFDRSDFDQAAAPGKAAAGDAERFVTAALEEYRYRRLGMAISIGLLAVLALLVWLKLRDMERHQP